MRFKFGFNTCNLVAMAYIDKKFDTETKKWPTGNSFTFVYYSQENARWWITVIFKMSHHKSARDWDTAMKFGAWILYKVYFRLKSVYYMQIKR